MYSIHSSKICVVSTKIYKIFTKPFLQPLACTSIYSQGKMTVETFIVMKKKKKLFHLLSHQPPFHNVNVI